MAQNHRVYEDVLSDIVIKKNLPVYGVDHVSSYSYSSNVINKYSVVTLHLGGS